MRIPAQALAIALVLAAGCAAPPRVPTPAPQPQVNLSGFSVAFKEGYVAGCEQSRSTAPRRDEGRMRRDADYAAGWNDGYSICRRRYR
jgi:hypothetical protein